MKINKDGWDFMKIIENQWKSLTENHWKLPLRPIPCTCVGPLTLPTPGATCPPIALIFMEFHNFFISFIASHRFHRFSLKSIEFRWFSSNLVDFLRNSWMFISLDAFLFTCFCLLFLHLTPPTHKDPPLRITNRPLRISNPPPTHNQGPYDYGPSCSTYVRTYVPTYVRT